MSSSSKKPVVVYGASGYTGRLVCEYLREYNIPFIAAGRSADKLAGGDEIQRRRHRDRELRGRRGEHTTEALTQLFKGASVVLNTVGPFAKFGHEVVQACLAAKCHYTDTTGEQDWLITLDAGVRREVRRGRPAAVAGPRADVHDRRDRRAAVPRDAGPRHARHRGVLGRQPDDRLDADDPRQRGDGQGLLPRAEPVRRVASRRRPLQPGRSPASTRRRSRCPGAARRTRCGSSRTRAWPTSRCSAACSTSR